MESSSTHNKTFPFLILLLGALVAVFNISVTNVAIPSIATALNANGLQIHFIADGFTIALAAFVLICGAIGDKYGRKLLFLVGCLIMAVASYFSFASQTANILVGWRMVAGLATAMLYPTTLSMITTLYPQPKPRLMAIGLWSGVSAAGAAVAPVVAGWLLQYYAWGSVFLVSVPLILVAVALGWWKLPSTARDEAARIDWWGGLLSVAFVGMLLFAIIIWPVSGFSPTVVGTGLGSVVVLGLFIWRERQCSKPLLDLTVFKNRAFAIASLTITLVAFAQLGVMFLAQQFVQNVLGYTTFQAGLSALPLSVAVLVASPISAKLSGRFGPRLVVASGLGLIGVGFVTALFWTVTSPYLQIAISYVMIGAGLGLTMTPMTNTIMNSLPANKAGIGSAMNDITRDFGNSLGIAVNGSIAAMSYAKVLSLMDQKLPPSQQQLISENIARTITSSLSGALEVAQRYPGVNSQQMLAAAKQAFLDGQIAAMGLSAGLCLIGMVLVWWLYPKNNSQN